MMVKSGTALANAASSGSCGKHTPVSRESLIFPVVDFRVGVPGYGMADPAKTVGTGGLQRLQHRFDPISQVQIGVADDGRRRPAGAIDTAGAGGGQALDKFN